MNKNKDFAHDQKHLTLTDRTYIEQELFQDPVLKVLGLRYTKTPLPYPRKSVNMQRPLKASVLQDIVSNAKIIPPAIFTEMIPAFQTANVPPIAKTYVSDVGVNIHLFTAPSMSLSIAVNRPRLLMHVIPVWMRKIVL